VVATCLRLSHVEVGSGTWSGLLAIFQLALINLFMWQPVSAGKTTECQFGSAGLPGPLLVIQLMENYVVSWKRATGNMSSLS